MSTAKFSTWLKPDGTENYKCRAWVNFNGTGTVTIRASGNVSSITDNGTGNYTVNFTTALPDANYSVITVCSKISPTTGNMRIPAVNEATAPATSNVSILFHSSFNILEDPSYTNVAIFR